MASIKQLDDRRFKITVSNGYRPDGKKICKAKTIRVPESIPKRGIRQYVACLLYTSLCTAGGLCQTPVFIHIGIEQDHQHQNRN